MADREIIKKGLKELMEMRVENMAAAVRGTDSEQVQIAMGEYRESESVAAEFINVQNYHQRFIELSDVYSGKHSGVLL